MVLRPHPARPLRPAARTAPEPVSRPRAGRHAIRTKIRLLATASGVLCVLAAAFVPARAQTPTIEGYPWPNSVRQGEQVGLFVSSSTGTYDIDIVREGSRVETVFSAQSLPAPLQTVPANASAAGCNWSRTLLLSVPQSWKSGAYSIYFRTSGVTRRGLFVVREDAPGSTSDILLVLSTATWQAYNPYGGKSLYEYNSTGGIRGHTVSFKRPYVANNGLGLYPTWERPFIQWAEGAGYTIEYATSLDLHADPTLESRYDLVLSVGHDEYWSKEMRDHLQYRTASGRNTAFFSGNTCWWQVRFEGAFDRMICYKESGLDPLTGIDNSRVTVKWRDVPVNRPENLLTGLSFAKGGYVNSNGWYPASEGYGDYTAYNTGHWVFAGTGLVDGSEFGYDASIVGYEVDGAAFNWVNGFPKVTGEDGTPMNFQILGLSPASKGHGTMGIFAAPGIVFNAATTDWSHGLAADPIVQQITRNVIDSLRVMEVEVVGVGSELPPLPFRVLAAPNPFATLTRISFDLPAEERVRIAVFDVQGRRVATLLDETLGPGSHALPWAGVDELGREVEAGVYLYRLEAGPVIRTGKAIKTR